MNHISFAWTTAALLAGRKEVTRREWKDRHAARFHAGDLVAAYNRNPRNGGHQVATIRLTQDPYQEPFALLPDSDWEGEGFAYLEEVGAKHWQDGASPREIWDSWKNGDPNEAWWVIRFELVEVAAST